MKWYAYHSIIRPLGIWQRHLSRLSWSLGNNCYQGRKNLRPSIVAIATLNTPFFAWQPPPRLPSSRAAFYQSNGSFPSSEATFPQSAAIYPNGISHDAWQLWQMTASLFIRKQKEQHRDDAAPFLYQTERLLSVNYCPHPIPWASTEIMVARLVEISPGQLRQHVLTIVITI